MKKEFAKAYEPRKVEKKWYDEWMENKVFFAPSETGKETYSILMPPPNVTGILHFGHVLNHTLQDLYSRWKRMQGYETCWFPGYDHAGIATHAKVERQLSEEGLNRFDIGREKFLERAWEWKEKYGGIILKQLKYLGVSCDWDRLLFTMDESASNAVREVFIRLFDEGLIYKGNRIINWSPLSQTALSDEEVEFKEVKEKLYTFKYHFADGSGEYLKIATVRAETIFGDVAVAVNPKDERYKKYVGKKVVVPYVGREVPIIEDEHANPEFGTGCVKITPAHDPNDFIVGEKHDLPIINSINPDGTLNEQTGEFNGMERFKARKEILKKLKEKDLIEKEEDYTHNVGFSQRGGEAIEPYLSEQWFVKMKPLAEIALKPVREGKIKFYPNHWVKTYEHWLENIRDWCISRQLWWGHRIPVYYAEDGRYTAARTEEEARKKLELPDDASLRQDEDVLDTWFSSWLWPLTTMNWLADSETEETPEMKTYLPTDLMVTAPDIIFFWIARMIMATMKFKNTIPFKDVYFTSMIRDGLGRKLSKSLGNSPDPLNIIEKYGTDAVRFTIIYLAPLGQDVRMDVDVKKQDVKSMEIGRNFANKIWNAGRFLLIKLNMESVSEVCPANKDKALAEDELSFADKWILSRFHGTINNIEKHLSNYKVNDYSKTLYDFIWADFCDWYVEIVKVQLNESDSPAYRQALLKFVIDLYEKILKLLHPVMPFITEEVWHLLEERSDDETIGLQKAPKCDENLISQETEDKFAYLKLIVEEIRRMRAELNLPPQKKIPAVISSSGEKNRQFIEDNKKIISALANCSELDSKIEAEKPEGSFSSVVRETEIFLILKGAVDIDKEKERLAKEIKRLEGNIAGSEKKLSNENFVKKAPQNIVEREKEKLESMKQSLEKVKANIESLG